MVSYPEDWEVKKLGEIATVKMCRRIFQSQTKSIGEIPFYKIGTFGEKADAYISRELYEKYKSLYPYPKIGDILLSAAGTIGRTVMFDGRDSYFQDSNIVWLDVKPNVINNKFLMYFYQSHTWKNLEGTTISRLYNNIILETSIPIPPLAEQKAIAETLETFDAHIKNLSELIEKKKAIRDGALNDLMTGRTRLKGFSGEWEVMKVKNLVTVIPPSLKVKNRNYLTFGHYPVIDQGQNFISGYTNENSVFPRGEYVIFGEHTCIVKYVDFAFAQGADGIKVLVTNNGHIITKYLYYCMSNIKMDALYSRHWLQMKEQIIPLPPLAEQKAIAETLTAFDDEIKALEAERDKIKKIRDGAMNDLLTGKIRLKF